jgi:iron complex transport system ATP-binding protein
VSVLSLEGVTVRTGGRTILGPVDLRIEPGEHWVVIGPNGGGKTTLLSICGAWRQPSGGRAEVLGDVLGRTDVRALRRRIGHVSHLLGERLRPRQPVIDVVLAGRAAALEVWWQDLDEGDRAAARRALEGVGCAELADREVGRLSLGERARVLIARAMVGAPDLLLFDEPAAGLDLPGRERLLRAMTDVASATSPPTTVLATHHLEEIPPSVTHALLLRAGQVVSVGPVGDTLRDEALAATFGMAIDVGWSGGRWWARAAAPVRPMVELRPTARR